MAANELLPPASPSRYRRKLALLIMAALLAAGGGYWLIQRTPDTEIGPTGKKPGGNRISAGGPPGMGGQQAPVVVADVGLRDMDVLLNALGTATASTSVTVRSRVDGPLLELHFKEGQIVRKGDLLATIDPKPFEAALAQTVGQRVHNEALLENARLDLERYQTLLEQDSISKQQVDTQRALVKQYEGTVQTDRGAEENARLQLSYTRITAPVAGRIGLSVIDPGNMISASDTAGLAVINQIKPINVIYSIPEDSLPVVLKKLNAGETIPVSAWDKQLRNKLVDGTVLAIDSEIDTGTGTIKIKALFENTDGLLYPNQFVNIRMRINRLEQATTVPVAAIQRGQQGTFVYKVLEDNTVKVQNVKTDYSDGEHVVILDGLQPGQRVVIDGADSLRDGMRVEAVSAATRAAATTPVARPTPTGSTAPAKPHSSGTTPPSQSNATVASPVTAPPPRKQE